MSGDDLWDHLQFSAAKSKREPDPESLPASERMKAAHVTPRAPSSDQKRVRRQMQRSKTGTQEETSVNTEAELLHKMAKASSADEQRSYAEQLESFRAGKAAAYRQQAEVDFGAQIVASTRSAHPMSAMGGNAVSMDTDWIATAATPKVASREVENAMRARATTWFAQRTAAVRADGEELAIQAHGAATQAAGQYGDQFSLAREAFVAQIEHLSSRTADGPSVYQPPNGTSLPFGVTNTEKFSPIDWAGGDHAGDQKSTDGNFSAPALDSGKTPEGDHAEDPATNPVNDNTHTNDGGNNTYTDALNGTVTPFPGSEGMTTKPMASRKTAADDSIYNGTEFYVGIAPSQGPGGAVDLNCVHCGQPIAAGSECFVTAYSPDVNQEVLHRWCGNDNFTSRTSRRKQAWGRDEQDDIAFGGDDDYDRGMSWSEVADKSSAGMCPASQEYNEPHIPDGHGHCAECGAEMSKTSSRKQAGAQVGYYNSGTGEVTVYDDMSSSPFFTGHADDKDDVQWTIGDAFGDFVGDADLHGVYKFSLTASRKQAEDQKSSDPNFSSPSLTYGDAPETGAQEPWVLPGVDNHNVSPGATTYTDALNGNVTSPDGRTSSVTSAGSDKASGGHASDLPAVPGSPRFGPDSTEQDPKGRWITDKDMKDSIGGTTAAFRAIARSIANDEGRAGGMHPDTQAYVQALGSLTAEGFAGVPTADVVGFVLESPMRGANRGLHAQALRRVLAGEVPEAFKKQWAKDRDDSDENTDAEDKDKSKGFGSDSKGSVPPEFKAQQKPKDGDSKGSGDDKPEWLEKKIDGDKKSSSRRTAVSVGDTVATTMGSGAVKSVMDNGDVSVGFATGPNVTMTKGSGTDNWVPRDGNHAPKDASLQGQPRIAAFARSLQAGLRASE